MKARLQVDGSAAGDVREIFLMHVQAALDCLVGQSPPSDEAVHDARKAVKRARAALRLLRPSIGEQCYKKENSLARDAAKPLTLARDAKVLEDALKQLLTDSGGAVRKLPLDGFLARLHAERSLTRQALQDDASQLKASRNILRGARRRVQQWPLLEDDWDLLGPALRRVYRAGRKAQARAADESDDEALHEWRKQCKYLWHAMQILLPLQPERIGELADRAHRLADMLGDDHDLAVLRLRVQALSEAFGSTDVAETLLDVIDARRHVLQKKAFAAGRMLYGRKPAAFVEHLEKIWHRWRATSLSKSH